MRYPHVDVMSVIEYALHMFDPKVKYWIVKSNCHFIFYYYFISLQTYPLPAVINSLTQDKVDIKTNLTEKKHERLVYYSIHYEQFTIHFKE